MDFISQISSTYLFKDLSEEQLSLIEKNSTEVVFGTRDIIYKQGSYASHAVYLLEGFVKVYVDKGKIRRIVKIVKPNWFVGLLSVYSYEKHIFSASAISDVKVRMIDKNALRQVLHENIRFNEKFIQVISMLGTNLTQFLVLQNTKNVRGRIAEILLHFSEVVYKSDVFPMTFTRKELGHLANTSTETAIRILNDMRFDEVLEITDKKIYIKDKTRLNNIFQLG